MKIIDVAEFYTDQGGGVKTYINQKLAAAKRLGHEMIVVAPGKESGEEERHGGRIIWVKGPRLPFDPRYVILWREKEVHKILDRENPDIVEGSSAWTGGLFAGRWKGDAVKTFIFHQDPVAVYPQTFLGQLFDLDRIDRMFGFYWNYLRRLSKKFDATIVSGGWLQDRVARFNLKNPVAVPFGINKRFFSPDRRNLEIRKKLLNEIGLDEDATLFLTVSRYHPEKRLSTIIEGFKLASQKKPIGLIVYGSGPIRKWIEYKAKGIKHLKLMGFTSNRAELANIMASADYFVHGSAAETFGLVVAEAICSGLPVVVPARGGAVDLANPKIAEIYETGDKKALSDALIRIISRNRDELAKACQDKAENSISTVDQHFDNLFALYQKMVDEKKNN